MFMGKIVRVVLADNRTYVGRLECIDYDCNLFVSSCCELVDNEAPYSFDYKVFNPKPQKHRYEYRFAGHIIVPKKCIKQILLDNNLTDKYPEDQLPIKKETILDIKA